MGDTPSNVREFVLSPVEFELTQQKLSKINCRAEKRGFTGRFEFNGVREIVSGETACGLPTKHVVYRCTLGGDAPSYGGWKFVARLDTVPDQNGDPLWIVRSAPGVEDSGIDRASLVLGFCAHCQTTRANRRKLMIVENSETGEQKQVGSTCIKDFLGWAGAPVWIDPDRVIDDLSEGFGGAPTASSLHGQSLPQRSPQ